VTVTDSGAAGDSPAGPEFFLATWEDTNSQNLANDLAMIHMNIADEASEMTMTDMACHVGNAAAQYRSKELWDLRAMPDYAVDFFIGNNLLGGNVSKPWVWKGLTQTLGEITGNDSYNYGKPHSLNDDVFRAVPMANCFSVKYEENVTPIMTQKDVIRF
jgi:hypothetical protein